MLWLRKQIMLALPYLWREQRRWLSAVLILNNLSFKKPHRICDASEHTLPCFWSAYFGRIRNNPDPRSPYGSIEIQPATDELYPYCLSLDGGLAFAFEKACRKIETGYLESEFFQPEILPFPSS